MTFNTAYSSKQLDFLSGQPLGVDVYLLIWGGLNIEKQIVMKAQINQTQPTGAFSTLTYDQTDSSFDKGSETDALEGYIVYLSQTKNIRDSYWHGRMRSDASATTLFIELTEVTISDDDYIFVLKDVRFSVRHPLEVNGEPRIDVDGQFQLPPPAISGIRSAYLGIIKSSLGYVDVVIDTTSATAIASGATVTGWALNLDAGTQIAFDSSTGYATIRYTQPGFYLPRFVVTDSNGNSQWFAPHITIDDENLSSAVNLNTIGGSFNYSTADGASGNIPVFDGVQNLLDRTTVAVYAATYPAIMEDNIIFVGQIRTETAQNEYDAEHANITTSNLQLEGIGQMMANQYNFSWLFENKSSPSNFYELKDATIWRVVASYLIFMTNMNNIYGLSFQDTSNDYLFREFPIERSYVLTAIGNILFTINGGFDWSKSGEIKLVRNAVMMNSIDRNALTTVANWDMTHYRTKGQGGNLWALERSHILRTGKAIVGGGWYTSAANAIDLLIAHVPGAVSTGGSESIEVNSQILTANQSRDNAVTEFRQRAGDAFAMNQDIDTLRPELPDWVGLLIAPSISQWHTHTILDTDNIRGFSYDTNTRWLMTQMSLNINSSSGRITNTTPFQIETSDLGYGIIITDPPEPVLYPQPVMPPLPSVGGLGETPELQLPTGFNPGTDSQPVDANDSAHNCWCGVVVRHGL
jgi:hypothetical protein